MTAAIGAQGEAAAVWMALDALKPWPENPRDNEAAIEAVVLSIKRFGFGAPILARAADHEVIAGHTRLLAAKKLGLDRVPVRLLDLDPVDAHLLALADNKLGEIAEWDNERLAALVADMQKGGIDLGVTGFSEDDLAKLIGEMDAEEPAPEGEDPKSQFLVLVTCKDEADQAAVIGRLQQQGLDVRALMS